MPPNKGKKVLCVLRALAAALFFAAVVAAFLGVTFFAPVLKIQFFPALDRKAWGVVAAVLLSAVLFGRFYCSVVCPFGILQDVIGFFSRRKSKSEPDRAKTRYLIAGVVFALFFSGAAGTAGWLDPYSNFGRVAAFFKNQAFYAGGIVFSVITILALWKKRFFCTTLCPVGAVLGLCAKVGPFKLRFSDKCVKCGKCASVCPCGCADPKNGTLDNERCVRCLNCVAVCPMNAVTVGREGKSVGVDLSRRGFLTGGLAAAAGVAAGAALAPVLSEQAKEGEKTPVCPPGALSVDDFAAKCTNCLACVSACKGGVLRPRGSGYATVHLEYGENRCLYSCSTCNNICPTGALTPLSLAEKQRRRIGLASFDKDKCVGCGMCLSECPRGAVLFREEGGDHFVTVDPLSCIGCGACVAVCPVKAIGIRPAAVQTEVSA